MNSSLTAVLSIGAFLVGQLLVTRRQWSGFLVWAASNCLVAVICVVEAQLAAASMFLVYFTANLCSMFRWCHERSASDVRHGLAIARGSPHARPSSIDLAPLPHE